MTPEPPETFSGVRRDRPSGGKTMTRENEGVTGTWVKYYDTFGRLWEDHGQPTVDQARRKYGRLVKDASVAFAQWGVKSVEGTIVLGEYRAFQECET